ncbi:hypothetical protein [Methylophaga sp.]|uniref:ImmA/IrrE family metallo-endopeptidase n=1 Tax=Methylophaga sp. TaxID=2024840 RepID=UPI003A8E40D8
MQNNMKTPITVKAAFETLREAGYPKSFIIRFLPEWWDNSLLKTSAGALQFALILKQRLGIDVSFGQDGVLSIPSRVSIAHTSFKRRAGTAVNELNIAANLGIATARIALLALKRPYTPIPSDPTIVNKLVCDRTGKKSVDFEGLLDFCWEYGIPVLFLKEIPRHTKRMTGMAVMVDSRPVILLGFNYSQFPKQLFVLAHELGHIANGHVENNGALIDEELEDVSEGLEGRRLAKKDVEEQEADLFALSLLRNGNIKITELIPRQSSSAILAAKAIEVGTRLNVDPGHLIVSYAKQHDDWLKANQALNFIEQPVSATQALKKVFFSNSDLSILGEESKEYLLSVQGFEG